MHELNLKGTTILVTGAAGFIGANLVMRLLKGKKPERIIGIDNLNDYYDVRIKEWRLKQIEKQRNIRKRNGYSKREILLIAQ